MESRRAYSTVRSTLLVLLCLGALLPPVKAGPVALNHFSQPFYLLPVADRQAQGVVMPCVDVQLQLPTCRLTATFRCHNATTGQSVLATDHLWATTDLASEPRAPVWLRGCPTCGRRPTVPLLGFVEDDQGQSLLPGATHRQWCLPPCVYPGHDDLVTPPTTVTVLFQCDNVPNTQQTLAFDHQPRPANHTTGDGVASGSASGQTGCQYPLFASTTLPVDDNCLSLTTQLTHLGYELQHGDGHPSPFDRVFISTPTGDVVGHNFADQPTFSATFPVGLYLAEETGPSSLRAQTSRQRQSTGQGLGRECLSGSRLLYSRLRQTGPTDRAQSTLTWYVIPGGQRQSACSPMAVHSVFLPECAGLAQKLADVRFDGLLLTWVALVAVLVLVIVFGWHRSRPIPILAYSWLLLIVAVVIRTDVPLVVILATTATTAPILVTLTIVGRLVTFVCCCRLHRFKLPPASRYHDLLTALLPSAVAALAWALAINLDPADS